eukprot:TRINITY_DN3282_c0_g1_i2.p3 TRINITY_DN3282_c0_g1~~TRINITY_DN3282_c0_g1_i2.p3  ORF type:complete len:108 (-),score=36.54 TRINITY_DN3282_c0_g1_i2:55-378(-)
MQQANVLVAGHHRTALGLSFGLHFCLLASLSSATALAAAATGVPPPDVEAAGKWFSVLVLLVNNPAAVVVAKRLVTEFLCNGLLKNALNTDMSVARLSTVIAFCDSL